MQKISDKNLAEAKRYLSNADEFELKQFAARQHSARLRLAKLKEFYSRNFSRMTRLHLLAACAIALGRFCGVSKVFDEIGEALMPIDAENQPRTKEWREFVKACEQKLPLEIRDELWLTAHFKDIENVRQNDLETKFYKEAEQHKDEPIWQLLRQHLEVTLGVRLMDKSAIAGMIPHETAIAESLALTVKKLSTACLHLVGRYTNETFRGVFSFSSNTPKDLLSYRQTAFEMTRYFLLSLSVSKIFRQGLRGHERGRVADSENWNLLETALGEKVGEINPLIREFYANPSRFNVTATLKLETLPARFWSRFLTLLFGQGLYEANLEEIPARFRIFQRKDGSMHFVRELLCDGKYRVFDSDFVIREGKLYEVFIDLKVAIEMKVAPIKNGGLSIQGERFLWRGRAMPTIGLKVDFQSRVENETLKIDGHLTMKPETKLGEFFAHKILRRPKDLGSIHYTVTRKEF
ncbi:MAG: hypothetical protein ACR2MG_08255 [Pyrinomonadaceae bacterium]